MQIDQVIQIFILLSFIILIIIMTKTFCLYNKHIQVVEGAILLGLILSLLLHIPLYINSQSYIYLVNNVFESILYFVISIYTFSIIFFIAIFIFKAKEDFIDQLLSRILRKPNLLQSKYIIFEHTEPGKSYNVSEISRITKIDNKKVFKALNLLVKENRARVAIEYNGDMIYYFS
ncbi:MAG: hypothetical protein AB1782_06160 [Cyanobacteriota bacterium]